MVELLAEYCWCRETLGSPTRPKLTDGSVVRLYRTKNQTAAGAGAASLFLIVFNRPPTDNLQKTAGHFKFLNQKLLSYHIHGLIPILLVIVILDG